jgi:ABC-type bacteriocin/lantibiotic exporter with double-glycine peptidase domain
MDSTSKEQDLITSTAKAEIHSIPEADQCTIQFRDIHFSVSIKGKEKKNKVILENVSGVFRPGRICAVMGASGAGKTSLLQILAGMLS